MQWPNKLKQRVIKAKVISAEGELEASIKLAEAAAAVLDKQKNAIILKIPRYNERDIQW